MIGHATAQTGSKDSPFMPPAMAMVSTSPSESLEFAGVNVMGDKTFISIYDKQTKKGRWISVSGTEAGISVLAYDARRDQVVVKSGEIQKTLTLRKATGALNAPTPVAVMPNPAGFAVANNDGNIVNAGRLPPPMPATATPETLEKLTPPVAAPVKAEAPPKPTTIARQEEEARMLVSDLLEIGMAQRKAYEEAQKKSAAAQTEQASQPAPATAQPPGS
jgi:hypothetical protein